jgi:hypothetical protein
MGRRGEDFIIVLDINAVFSSEELAVAEEAARGAGGETAAA